MAIACFVILMYNIYIDVELFKKRIFAVYEKVL